MACAALVLARGEATAESAKLPISAMDDDEEEGAHSSYGGVHVATIWRRRATRCAGLPLMMPAVLPSLPIQR